MKTCVISTYTSGRKVDLFKRIRPYLQRLNKKWKKMNERIRILEEYIEILVKNHKLNTREHQILLNMLEDDNITKEDLSRKAVFLD